MPEIAKDKKEEAAKPVPKEEPKPAAKEEEPPKVERRSRAAVQAERAAEEKAEEEELAPKRVDKSERNAIMEQMKRLQEGYNDLEVDSDVDYSLTESESEDERPARRKPQKKVEEEEDLSDLDLLDPFGSEPVPVVQKKVRDAVTSLDGGQQGRQRPECVIVILPCFESIPRNLPRSRP